MHNKTKHTLFVCEFITGGGLAGAILPQSLAQEGMLMRDALLRDLSQLDNWQLITTHDSRLSAPDLASSTPIKDMQQAWEVWQTAMANADAVWVIAPETDQILYRLAKMAQTMKVRWIGPQLEAIQLTSSKLRTYKMLAKSGLPTIPTFTFREWFPDHETSWVVKPDDGAGCDATFVFDNQDMLREWFDADAQRACTHVIQPYVAGTAASLCALGVNDRIHILSNNLQRIHLQDGKLSYVGGVINGAQAYADKLQPWMDKLSRAIPGLAGYFGVDVLLDTDTAEGMVIVEINPRLTTSYSYLRQAMGYNPAILVMDALFQPNFSMPVLQHAQITFNI